MHIFLAQTVAGIATYGCVYALTALGLVVTYTTSGIFNFAQGAVGMLAAFFFWQLEHYGIPSWAAFIIAAFVFAPLVGALIEAILMRRLAEASLESKLTVTVGLLLFLLAVASTFWNPETVRVVTAFFRGDQITIGGVALSAQQLIVIGTAIAVTIALRIFLYVTRAGVATRAVVDDRDLASLTGAAPNNYAMLGWAIGSSLAAIAGILLAPTVNLDITTLTLLVINGYAAAMVGRLKSLPWTFAGAIVLGLLQAYATQYLPSSPAWANVATIVPMIYLFVVIIALPQSRATITRQVKRQAARLPALRESLIVAGGFLVVAVVVSRVISNSNLNYADTGVCLAIVMLSLVLLVGYGGQVSLCQLTFAGIGAYGMGKVGGSGGSLLGLVAAVALSAAVGALVALPALRLRGLYMALATLAFGFAMDTEFFGNTQFFGISDSLNIARPHIPGMSFNAGNRSYFVFLCVIFVAAGIGLQALRRSQFGRRLFAMSDSPAACLTLGVDMTRTKLIVFATASGLAGLGGALYGGAQGSISGGASGDFTFLLSLTLLLMAVIWGIRTIGGMLLGGVSLALGPLLQSHLSHPRNVLELLVGLGAIGIAQNPEGTFGSKTPLHMWRQRQGRQTGESTALAEPEKELSSAAG